MQPPVDKLKSLIGGFFLSKCYSFIVIKKVIECNSTAMRHKNQMFQKLLTSFETFDFYVIWWGKTARRSEADSS